VIGGPGTLGDESGYEQVRLGEHHLGNRGRAGNATEMSQSVSFVEGAGRTLATKFRFADRTRDAPPSASGCGGGPGSRRDQFRIAVP
jgi:hypothetical protein